MRSIKEIREDMEAVLSSDREPEEKYFRFQELFNEEKKVLAVLNISVVTEELNLKNYD